MTRRAAVLLAAALAVLATTVGTGAFSVVSMDRGFVVGVVDDDSAYLGVEFESNDAANGTTNLTVTVRNQFPDGAVLDEVTVATNDTTKTITSLRSGDEDTITFENASCDGTATIEATGDGVEVTFERTIDC